MNDESSTQRAVPPSDFDPIDSDASPAFRARRGHDRDLTRDRREELRDAVRSALEQKTQSRCWCSTVDPATGRSEMPREEFPDVPVVRYDDDAGVAARRNDAAALAEGGVIVSIDDDAVFTWPRIVAHTLADLDHPRIAAVAIPYTDVGSDPQLHQRAPEPNERWVTSIFRATAYAIRRKPATAAGRSVAGFRSSAAAGRKSSKPKARAFERTGKMNRMTFRHVERDCCNPQ